MLKKKKKKTPAKKKRKIFFLERLGVEARGRQRVGREGEVAERVADRAPGERVDGVEARGVVGGHGEGGLLALVLERLKGTKSEKKRGEIERSKIEAFFSSVYIIIFYCISWSNHLNIR